MEMVWCMFKQMFSGCTTHRNNDGMLQSRFISHVYQNGNNSNLKWWNISWFAITFKKNSQQQQYETDTQKHNHSFDFLRVSHSLALSASLRLLLFFPSIFNFLPPSHIWFTAPISYFAFHVHHVAMALFRFILYHSYRFTFSIVLLHVWPVNPVSWRPLFESFIAWRILDAPWFLRLPLFSGQFFLIYPSVALVRTDLEEQMRKMTKIKTISTFQAPTSWQNMYLFFSETWKKKKQFHIGNKYAWKIHRTVTFHLLTSYSFSSQ